MGCYRHLTRDDREEIAALRAAGHSMRAVAAAVGKAPSSISRELKRNALDSGRYAAHVADGADMARRQRRPSSSGASWPAATSAGVNPRPGCPATRSRTEFPSMSGRKTSMTGPR